MENILGFNIQFFFGIILGIIVTLIIVKVLRRKKIDLSAQKEYLKKANDLMQNANSEINKVYIFFSKLEKELGKVNK